MSLISRFDPVREVMSLRNAMDQLLSQSFVSPSWATIPTTVYVPMDVCETEQGYTVRVSLPGVRPENVDITLEQNTLTIRGRFPPADEEPEGEERREEEQRPRKSWLLREITAGTFERTITFGRPVDAEHVEARLEHGMLTLNIPFAQGSRPRKIALSGQQRQEQIAVESSSGN
jgi:HSP20 family protein